MPQHANDRRPSSRPLLAIDSSTEQAGVALFDGHRAAELSWDAGRSQTTSLLVQIHHLLGLHDLTVTDLAALAVATGPGTFTGLRIGVSVAKGLVLGLGIPLLGVPTLDAAAIPYAPTGHPVVAVVAAGRGRLVWAEYRSGAAGWAPLATPRNGTVDDLAAHLASSPSGTIVTGELTADQESVIAALGGAMVVPRPLRGRRPAAVAALAWRRFATGDGDDPATLEPVYLGR